MENSWLDRNRNLIFALLSGLAMGGAGVFYLNRPAQSTIEILPAKATPTAAVTATIAPTATPTPAPLRIYVTGAVVNSDVYLLPPGSIIKDAINAAGGFTPKADPERINQALELQDQQQIHVPRQDEANAPPPVQGGQPESAPDNSAPIGSAQQINLNTATPEELDSLPGIGPAIAQRIIEYRETTGGFSSVEEVTQVSGIGEATFTKIKELITVK